MIENKVNEKGLIGNLYLDNNITKQMPGIILLSGSDGGIPGANAIPLHFIETLVNSGFVVFALGYFGVHGLPQTLESIKLEYFEHAIHWLSTHPKVKKDAIAIIGQSRGAELALLLGTLFHEPKAIVAFAPSCFVTGGFPHPNKPAWEYRGGAMRPFLGGLMEDSKQVTELEDLIYATKNHFIPEHQNSEDDPFIIADLFVARNAMKNSPGCAIAVEKITCPILLFSGTQDAIWPSQYYCEAIMNRLQQHKFSESYNHINYDQAGHGLIASFDGPIYHPVGGFWCKLGGDPEGNHAANQNAILETIQFLSFLHLDEVRS